MASNVAPENEEGLDLQSTLPSSFEDKSFPSGPTEAGGVTKPSLTDGWQIDKPLDRCMLQMFDSQLWTDVTFRCGDQAPENLDDRVCAHKIILAARSPVFQAMLFGPCQNMNAEVVIEDAESEHFKMFLMLLYSDDFDLYDEYDDLVHILALAHKYQVQFVVEECSRKLGKQISVDNACALLDKALLYDIDELSGLASDFIDQNAEAVLVTDGFLEMSLRCLTYTLKGNTFFAKEDDIFSSVMEWARQRCESTDGQALRKTLGDAFYYLRTPTMTKEKFTFFTKKTGYYSPDEYERILSRLSNPKASVEEITCNSTIPRHPLEFTIRRGEDPLLKLYSPGMFDVSSSHDYVESTSETISITVKDNICLMHISLKRIGNGKVGDSKFTLTNMPLSVRKEINNGDVHSSSHTLRSGGTNSFKIHFSQPISMCPGQSYVLNVTVKHDVSGDMYLKNCHTSDIFIVDSNDVRVHDAPQRNKVKKYGSRLNNEVLENDEVLENLTFRYESKRN